MITNIQIDENAPFYQYKTWSRTIQLQESGENLIYVETSRFSKKVASIPKANLKVPNQFSRNYHLGPLATGGFLLVLSGMLINKRWGTDHWSLYLGMALASVILLIGLYYLIEGKKYGEVELAPSMGDNGTFIYIKMEEYHRLKQFIASIKNTGGYV